MSKPQPQLHTARTLIFSIRSTMSRRKLLNRSDELLYPRPIWASILRKYVLHKLPMPRVNMRHWSGVSWTYCQRRA